uniref:Uncharacterized protein n=1 Tax=Brassica oleracea TaxID=3712 RepID=B2D2H5_BRAOL|nr:unknown protein [Brassica oleracea]
MDFIGRLKMMQSDVNPHKADFAKQLDLDKTLSTSKQIGDLFSPDKWRENEEGNDDRRPHVRLHRIFGDTCES